MDGYGDEFCGGEGEGIVIGRGMVLNGEFMVGDEGVGGLDV
ncbi:hypothetical protein [Bacillus mycoides]